MEIDGNHLSEVERVIHASPQRVFAELRDGWGYVGWVVGANHVRDVEANWPQPGTRIHHKVGSWPAVIADNTESLEYEPDRRLRLKARGWPFGEAIVEIEARPEPADAGAAAPSAVVVMREAPYAGPGRWVDNPALRWVLKRRNVESLRRLADRAEKRPSPE
jgi:hypothetical protein